MGKALAVLRWQASEIMGKALAVLRWWSCLPDGDLEKLLSGDDEASLQVGLKSWCVGVHVHVRLAGGLERFA